jgi:hypothetical protein
VGAEYQYFPVHWYVVRRVREEAAHVMVVLVAPWWQCEAKGNPQDFLFKRQQSFSRLRRIYCAMRMLTVPRSCTMAIPTDLGDLSSLISREHPQSYILKVHDTSHWLKSARDIG